ncbi:TetR/AcrR family transcriptional regulator [Pseudofrankia asymbiotica]|uniref:TetR family transcriptional regulator n=1 Tax=Pseudofrankia asymbiotica TaxID=1834516 RepID=A0A1V2I202_9ACTN|nr:TetR/AcrR family transcriptional regulator [Pseudofrankia asymbiotica]ONH23901.1 TetR family transcriptional regulator [Pseudofrankia asymbiotica]
MARDTRERLLDAGLALFAGNGLAGTTVSDLEARAGLRAGSGSFYRHFTSKEALFEAVVRQELDRFRTSIGDTTIGESTVADVKIALALEFHEALTTLGQLGQLEAIIHRDAHAMGDLFDEVEGLYNAALDASAARLNQLMESGQLPRRDPQALAVTIRSTLIGYHLNTQSFRRSARRVPPADLIAILIDLISSK